MGEANGRIGNGRTNTTSSTSMRKDPTPSPARRSNPIDQASEESFPASDAPAWSPSSASAPTGSSGYPSSEGGGRGGQQPVYPVGMDPRERLSRSASTLGEDARRQICQSLAGRVYDATDFYSQIKVAHWNVKGPYFAALHELFDELAATVTKHNDEMAERAVMLGGRIEATVRRSTEHSRLPEYPTDVRDGLEHTRIIAERLETFIEGVAETLQLADSQTDRVTADLLSDVIASMEKYGWQLRATLERAE